VNAAILGGDLYPSSAIGINLPNSNWVRAAHGSKSVTIGNLTAAYEEAAKGSGFREEFVIDAETVAQIDRYSAVTDDLHTDLHECLGHGSGRLLPGVDADALGVYGATIEEARADLFGLYYIADKKMAELGLVPDAEAWKAQYYSYMMNGAMTQLVRIKRGCVIEEAHMRNRSLIAHWCLAQAEYWGRCFNMPPALELIKRDGKTYLRINDYITLRQYVGQLLAEIQRIKSEGDFAAAKNLVERYAVNVDAGLHEEMLSRYEALHLSPYKGFVNPVYTPITDAEGHITDITVSYDEEFDEQQLRYSKQYATL
jgi:dipeptidyl-peptidase-3